MKGKLSSSGNSEYQTPVRVLCDRSEKSENRKARFATPGNVQGFSAHSLLQLRTQLGRIHSRRLPLLLTLQITRTRTQCRRPIRQTRPLAIIHPTTRSRRRQASPVTIVHPFSHTARPRAVPARRLTAPAALPFRIIALDHLPEQACVLIHNPSLVGAGYEVALLVPSLHPRDAVIELEEPEFLDLALSVRHRTVLLAGVVVGAEEVALQHSGVLDFDRLFEALAQVGGREVPAAAGDVFVGARLGGVPVLDFAFGRLRALEPAIWAEECLYGDQRVWGHGWRWRRGTGGWCGEVIR